MLHLTHATPAPGEEPPDFPWLPFLVMTAAVVFSLGIRWCALHLVP